MVDKETKPLMSLADFWDKCDRHDWFYMYSDDHSVYQRGMTAQNELEKIANSSVGLREIYDGFRTHHFTGKPWGNEKQPKPKYPGDEPTHFVTREGDVWHPIQHLRPREYPIGLRWEDGRIWSTWNGWHE